MLLNHVLFWMMLTEGAICLVLSLPVGKSLLHAVVQFASSRLAGPNANTAVSVVLGIVSLLFLSDVSTCYKHHSRNEQLTDGMRIRLLAAQRDMYISGFCLFLFLLLRLVYMSMGQNLRLEKSLAAMKKQAEGASTGYKGLLTENESIKKQLDKVQLLLGDKGEGAKSVDVLAQLVEENSKLSTQLAEAEKRVKAAETSAESVKKQAAAQSESFMKLVDEKNDVEQQRELVKTQNTKIAALEKAIKDLTDDRDALKSQIQDYDFMFADAKKKAE